MCAPIPEEERTRQYFVAECIAANCQLTDLRNTGDAACLADSECMLRDGTGCCPDCDGQGYLSLHSMRFLNDTCGVRISCPACLPPQPPPPFEPYCDLDRGRCWLRSAEGGAAGAAPIPP
jgi:hypothetical protein